MDETWSYIAPRPDKLFPDDGSDDAGTHGTATFANREAQAFFHGDRRNQADLHRHVIARQHHFFVGRQFDRARYVRRAEVKLRTIALEERRMTATDRKSTRLNYSH